MTDDALFASLVVELNVKIVSFPRADSGLRESTRNSDGDRKVLVDYVLSDSASVASSSRQSERVDF